MKIEFDGLISEKNQLIWNKRVNKQIILFVSLMSIGVIIFIFIINLLCYFFLDEKSIYVFKMPEVIILLILVPIFDLLMYKLPDNIILRFRMIHHVIITEDEIMCEQIFWGGKWKKKPITKVKKVIDYGEAYYVLFSFMLDTSWVCQKKNIVQGTIEEFEVLFQSKIIRKNEESK